ncbi:MAG: hypothetical protein K0S42_1380 [Microvirga sp.]|nr:hypothetical protein [Microvirga sp.]
MPLRIFARRVLIAATALFGPVGGSSAAEFRIEEVPSVTAVVPAKLKPKTIVFSDQRDDKLTDAGTGLIRFADWARERPEQKQFLGLFPGYAEPTIKVSVHGIPKTYTEKLHMYVVEARFLIGKAPGSVDLARFTRLDTLDKIDPSIKHRRISAEQAAPQVDAQSAHNRHPGRRWCETSASLCIESRYPLEGKLPVGIRLANKLEEGGKKISEFMEFQTEIRVLPSEEVDRAGLMKLTALEAPSSESCSRSFRHILPIRTERSQRFSWRWPSKPMCWSARRSSRPFPCCAISSHPRCSWGRARSIPAIPLARGFPAMSAIGSAPLPT